MRTARRASIRWSDEQVSRGLPTTARTIDPAWFGGARADAEEGWSLVCEFDAPPSEQGNPSTAWVGFLVDEAPHERLRPGASLQMFERATGRYARVELLD